MDLVLEVHGRRADLLGQLDHTAGLGHVPRERLLTNQSAQLRTVAHRRRDLLHHLDPAQVGVEDRHHVDFGNHRPDALEHTHIPSPRDRAEATSSCGGVREVTPATSTPRTLSSARRWNCETKPEPIRPYRSGSISRRTCCRRGPRPAASHARTWFRDRHADPGPTAVSAPVISSSTCKASALDVRCARPLPCAHSMSARPMPRCCGIDAGSNGMSVHSSSPLRFTAHRPVERVRVGDGERRLGAVHLDVEVARRLHVEARHEGRDGARLELHERTDVGRHFHIDELPLERLRQNRPLRTRDPRRHAHRTGGPEELHERRQVVGPHVEERPRTVLIEDRRVRVPALGSRSQHEGVRRERLADVAAIDRGPGRLQSGPEKRVGRAAEPHPLRGRELHQRLSLGEFHTERLFAESRLPRLERRPNHGRVRERRREIHHGVDVGVGEHRVERPRLRAELRRQLLGPVRVLVDTRRQLHERQLRHRVGVRAADDAAPDDRDAAHARPPENPPPTR